MARWSPNQHHIMLSLSLSTSPTYKISLLLAMGVLKAAWFCQMWVTHSFQQESKIRLPVIERLQQQPLQPFRADKQSDPLQSDKEINFHLVCASAPSFKCYTSVQVWKTWQRSAALTRQASVTTETDTGFYLHNLPLALWHHILRPEREVPSQSQIYINTWKGGEGHSRAKRL